MEGKLRQEQNYLNYVDYPVSFRRAMELQVTCYGVKTDMQSNDVIII